MQITHFDQAEQMATQVSGLVERSGVEWSGVEIFVRKKLPDCIVMTLCHSQSVLHSEVGQCNHSGSSALISTTSEALLTPQQYNSHSRAEQQPRGY